MILLQNVLIMKLMITLHPLHLDVKCTILTKADLLTRFRSIEGANVEEKNVSNTAMVIDMSVIIKVLANRKSIRPKSFRDFALNYVHPD